MNLGAVRIWLAGAMASANPAPTVEPENANIEQLTQTLQSSATHEEKTSFLIEYLLAQRGAVLDFVKTLLFALFVYIIGKKVVKLCLRLTNNWMQKREIEVGVQNFVMSFARVIYHLILIFIVAWILGIGATIIALVGSAGLAIGLALQGSLANLAGGVLILALKPFKVGEYISVTGVEGTVECIDIFYTHVTTTDNKTIVIPNGTITNATITNITNVTRRMLILDFSLPYDADIDALRNTLLKIMEEDGMIFQDDIKEVVISKLLPLRVQMQLKAWVRTENYWEVRYRMLEKMKIILKEHGASCESILRQK